MMNATHMFVLIFVSVFAVNSIGSNATRVALRQATSHRRFKRIFAWASGGVQITQMFMPFVTGVLIAFWGWRWAVIVLAIPVVIAGVWIELAGKASSPEFRDRFRKHEDNGLETAGDEAWIHFSRINGCVFSSCFQSC